MVEEVWWVGDVNIVWDGSDFNFNCVLVVFELCFNVDVDYVYYIVNEII